MDQYNIVSPKYGMNNQYGQEYQNKPQQSH